MKLRRNGRGEFLHPNGTRTPINWDLTGDVLEITPAFPAWFRALMKRLGTTAFDYRYHEGQYRLKTAAKHEIVLESRDHRTVVFVRWRSADGMQNE